MPSQNISEIPELSCVRQDIREMNVSIVMAADRRNGERGHAVPTLNKLGQKQEEVDSDFT
jgi:hypothetical protein